MRSSEWKEILKKCFGKQKDEKYHAIAMLAIYAIFLFILVLVIRLSASPSTNNQVSPTPTPTINNDVNIEEDTNNESSDIITNDINYSYSYTISYNGISEVYLGKKVDDKEKFTLIKDGITTDYAKISDNYLILEDGIYRITENPSSFYKYCDTEKILSLVENEIYTENDNTIKYSISNSKIAKEYKDSIIIDNEKSNLIKLTMSSQTLKAIDLDLSNYISSIKENEATLIIHMEFADIGTTENFEIKVS